MNPFRPLAPVLALAAGSLALAASGDTTVFTATLAGKAGPRVTMLEMNGALYLDAKQLAPALIEAGWLDRTYLKRFRDGSVTANQIGGHHYVIPAEFARGFGLGVQVDAAKKTLALTKTAPPREAARDVTKPATP